MKKIFAFIIVFISGLVFAQSGLASNQEKACSQDCHKPIKEMKYKTDKECARCHAPSKVKGKVRKTVALKTPANNSQSNKQKDFTNMVFIPEGEFIMGTDDRLKDEKPAHVVYIEGFYIDIYEVTNQDYRKFMEYSGAESPDHWIGRTFPDGKADHPVTYVSWFDADSYCKWVGKRLPREREWEKAARGTDGRVYPWGNEWDLNKSNNPLQAIGDTQPVGSYEKGKSPYGLYDMSGNVWEWVDEYYFPHPGSDYVSPEFGTNYRLLKGGSWWDCSFYGCGISAPTYNRAFFEPSVKGESYGFRCVIDG